MRILKKINYRVKKKYGFVPCSWLDLKKDKELSRYVADNTKIRDTSDKGKAKARGGGVAKGYKFSEFNPTLAEFIIKKYSEEGDVILDPFCGRATRGLIANKMKRNYIGYDVAPSTIKFVNDRIKKLKNHKWFNKGKTFNVILADGTILDKTDKKVDMIFTCPPYFSMEKYERAEGQLSDYKWTLKDYPVFFSKYKRFIDRSYELLKTSNKENVHFLVVVTSNFRIQGRIVPFTLHTQYYAIKRGFILHDELVYRNYSPFIAFTNQREERLRRCAKVHETVSVFRKEE